MSVAIALAGIFIVGVVVGVAGVFAFIVRGLKDMR